MWEIWVWSLSREDALEEERATHSSVLAWEISWSEEPGGLQSKGSQSQTRLSNWAHPPKVDGPTTIPTKPLSRDVQKIAPSCTSLPILDAGFFLQMNFPSSKWHRRSALRGGKELIRSTENHFPPQRKPSVVGWARAPQTSTAWSPEPVNLSPYREKGTLQMGVN